MKRLLLTTILISAMTANTFAFDFGAAVSNFFGIKKPAAEAAMQSDTKVEVKTQMAAPANTNMRSAKILSASSTVSATSTSTQDTCEDKEMLTQKSDKIKLNIKKQTEDRDKLVKSLQKVAATTDTKNTKAVNLKIAEVKLKIDSTIDTENTLLSKIASTSEVICDRENSATTSAKMSSSTEEIKNLEETVSKELKDVKVFIKVDLKEFLENL